MTGSKPRKSPSDDRMAAHVTRPLTSTHWGVASLAANGDGTPWLDDFGGDRAPSPLMRGVVQALQGPTRIRRPAIRKGWLDGTAPERGSGTYVECSWDTALNLVEERLRKTQASHSNSGIFAGSYGWGSAGRFHNSQAQLKRFLNTIGGFVDQRQTYSFAAGQIICPYVVGDNRILFGGETTTWPAIIKHAGVILFFGGLNEGNTQVASGGLVDHQTLFWLRAAHDAGIRMISIGPRRDVIEGLPEIEWVPLRPGTDTAMILAIIHELIASDRIDRTFLSRYTTGFDRLSAYATGQIDQIAKTPEWAAEICDIPAATIRDLAAALAQNPSFITASWSVQRQQHGEQPLWMLIALAAALGEIGLPGRGVSFGYGSVGNRGVPKVPVSSPRFSAGDNPTGLYIPVSRFAEMILNPGKVIPYDGGHITYPDIDLVWWAGGNPFHHHQDINRLRQAFQKPSTIIINELWWTATARHADIVLPAASGFERNDISASPTCDHIIASKAQLSPFGESKTEYQIFTELAERFGTEHAFTEGRSERDWLRHIYDNFRQQAKTLLPELPDFDSFWEMGHMRIQAPFEDYTLFEDFRSNPRTAPLATGSGRIEIHSPTLEALDIPEFASHPVWAQPAEWLGNAPPGALHLISPQPRARLHSQLDGVGVSSASKNKGREPILMNPEDAAARGLSNDDTVKVYNERGCCIATVTISSNLRSGVAELATGAWYAPDENGIDLHGNPNVLTPDLASSTLSQAPSHNTTLVFIERTQVDFPAPRIHFEIPLEPVPGERQQLGNVHGNQS